MTYSYENEDTPERITLWVVNNGHKNVATFKEDGLEEAVALMLTCKEQGIIDQLKAYRDNPYDHWKYQQREPSVLPFRVSKEEFDRMFKEDK